MIIIQVFPKLNMSIIGLVSTKLNWTMDNQHAPGLSITDIDLRLYTTRRIFSRIIFIVHTADALLAKIMSILMGLKEWI
jgi:hypothetical protein